jgi:hypothetical protein
VRHVIVIVAALVVGCGPPADPKRPGTRPPPTDAKQIAGPIKHAPPGHGAGQVAGQGAGQVAGNGAGQVAGNGAGQVAGQGSNVAVVLPSIGCPSPTCAFHAGASAYFTCLAGGAGTCFHFGAPCAPPDSCMYDPSDRVYKRCARTSEGTCTQWSPAAGAAGATCGPATKCMFNPSDGLHHQCDEIAGGGCKRYGALCAP